MKIGGGVVFGGQRAAAFPTLLIGRRRRATFPCSSSTSPSSSSSSSSEHESFIKDIGAAQPPKNLNHLLRMLQVKGDPIISPAAKKGLFPLAIPLSKNGSGSITALLRWPTAPPGMEMPVVEVRKYGVWLLAKSVDQYIHRMLVEEDAKNSEESNDELFHASGDAGQKLYKKGDFSQSRTPSLESYILQKVGLFPDILERKVKQHFEKGDHVSAMVTGEFYTKKEHFPGFGRPYVFNSEVLLKVGRKIEAKDAARGALKSPWWTLGCEYQEVANIAEWEDEQIEFIKEKVSEEGKQADLKRGKDPIQVVMDEAAFLLDLACVEEAWDEYVERIAECYKEAGLPDIANFLTYAE